MTIPNILIPDELPDKLPNEFKARHRCRDYTSRFSTCLDLRLRLRLGEHIVLVIDKFNDKLLFITNFGSIIEYKIESGPYSYTEINLIFVDCHTNMILLSKDNVNLIVVTSCAGASFDFIVKFIDIHIIGKSDNSLFEKWQSEQNNLDDRENELDDRENELNDRKNELDDRENKLKYMSIQLNEYEASLNNKCETLSVDNAQLKLNEEKLQSIRNRVKKTMGGIDMRATIQIHQEHLLAIANNINDAVDLIDYDCTSAKQHAAAAIELAECHPSDFGDIENLGPFVDDEIPVAKACD
jgi:hypothetical protein